MKNSWKCWGFAHVSCWQLWFPEKIVKFCQNWILDKNLTFRIVWVNSAVGKGLLIKSHLTTFQVVQEYERAVIFRLGRLLSGGSRGPGKYLEYNSSWGFFYGGKKAASPFLHLFFGGKPKTFNSGGAVAENCQPLALRFSSFQVFSSYFRASRITQRSTFAPRLLTFPRRRFVLDDKKSTTYNSLLQQCSTMIISLIKRKKNRKKELETSNELCRIILVCYHPTTLFNPRMQSYNTQ